MTSVKEIEAAISQLPPAKVAEIAAWITNFQAQEWDRQIAEDMAQGRLDALLEEAAQDFEAGRCKPW